MAVEGGGGASPRLMLCARTRLRRTSRYLGARSLPGWHVLSGRQQHLHQYVRRARMRPLPLSSTAIAGRSPVDEQGTDTGHACACPRRLEGVCPLGCSSCAAGNQCTSGQCTGRVHMRRAAGKPSRRARGNKALTRDSRLRGGDVVVARTACSSGFFSVAAGSGSCTICPGFSSSASGSNACTCQAGYYSATGLTTSAACTSA